MSGHSFQFIYEMCHSTIIIHWSTIILLQGQSTLGMCFLHSAEQGALHVPLLAPPPSKIVIFLVDQSLGLRQPPLGSPFTSQNPLSSNIPPTTKICVIQLHWSCECF